MSVLRQLNVLGQQRLDVPHIRSIESSIAADFDVVAGRVQAGDKAVVVRGFRLANFSAGTLATNIQLSTADSILYNVGASESGTFLWVPDDRETETLNSATNGRVQGGFTANQVNYIGLDLVRTADDTTSDLVQFLDPNSLQEQAKNVPLARTLDYRIIISTTPFSASSNIVPIAKVKTNTQNQVDSAAGSVEDARNIMWRLGSGGDFPNRFNSFSWPQNRVEPTTIFTGGDKGIESQKDWMDALMSRVWEIGGGENWYSPTADRNVYMTRTPSPAVFSLTGDNFEWVSGLYAVNHLHWQGLKLVFENANSTGVYFNTVADQLADDPGTPANAVGSKTALAVGDCIYVDIDRTSNATVVARKAALQTLGSPSIPGTRWIIAWRNADAVFTRNNPFPVNTSFQVATITAVGAVRLAYAAGTPATPTVPPLNGTNSISIGTGSYLISGNNAAIIAVGGGTGAGLLATGGSTSGPGVLGIGGGPNGHGLSGQGTGAGAGVNGVGGPNSPGIFGTGGTGNAPGIQGQGTGTGAGVNGVGGVTNGTGVTGLGTGTGAGGSFTGGVTGAAGVRGNGTGTSAGVEGVAGGAGGYGGQFTGNGIGYGVRAIGGNSYVGGADGAGIYATSGTAGQSNAIYAVGPTNNVGSGPQGEFGAAILGIGGAGTSGGRGVMGIGGPGRSGVFGLGGTGDSTGVTGSGGPTNGIGVIGNGSGTGVGVRGNGSNSDGVQGYAGGIGTSGVYGQGGTDGAGVWGQGQGTGTGVVGIGGGSGGIGGVFTSGTAATATTPQSAVQLTNGYLRMTGMTSPNSNVAILNTLTPANICKAWGTLTVGADTQLDGFNCTITRVGGPDRLVISFAQPMANANYAVAVSAQNSTSGGLVNRQYDVEARTANGFNVRAYDSSGAGTSLPPGVMSIIVFGRQ